MSQKPKPMRASQARRTKSSSPVWKDMEVPGPTPLHPPIKWQVPVNRKARRIVQKRDRAARNRKIAAMRVVLRDMRAKLVRFSKFEGRDKYLEAFITGRAELNSLMGNDA